MSLLDRPLQNAILYDEAGDTINISASGSMGVFLTNPTSVNAYAAATGVITPGTTPQDVVTIQGSATKVVRVLRLAFGTVQTSVGTNTWFVLKRSTANTGGTSANITMVPYDSISPAATAAVKTYSVNPTAGTLIGNVQVLRAFSPTTATSPAVVMYICDFTNGGLNPGVVLRGTGSTLSLNFGGAALPSGLTLVASYEWIEE